MDAGESSSRLRSSSEVVIANIKLVLDSLVGKNPYRVLGVYGNATSKEVQKNLSRIAAFAKVGRTEEFYTDFNVAFRVSFQRLNAGSEDTHFKLERDEEMVAAAQAQLHSAGDRLLHLCFWWTCATPADEAAFRKLETGDLEGAREIWNRRSNVSAVVNAMTTSWLLADTATVGAKAEELFCTMGDKLCALIDPTLRLEPEALIRRFFVALTEVGCRVETLPQGTHEVWRRLWSEYAAMPYLRAIEKEVAAAASLGDVPAENLQAAKRLKTLAVRVLPQLKRFMPTMCWLIKCRPTSWQRRFCSVPLCSSMRARVAKRFIKPCRCSSMPFRLRKVSRLGSAVGRMWKSYNVCWKRCPPKQYFLKSKHFEMKCSERMLWEKTLKPVWTRQEKCKA